MPRRDLAGRLDEHERHAFAGPFLVAREVLEHVVHRRTLELRGQPARGQEAGDLPTQRVPAREPQRGEQAEIIDQLKLRRPIYSKTTNYGHFGKNDRDLTWEATNKVSALLAAV